MVVICCYLETEHYEVMKFRVNNFAYFEKLLPRALTKGNATRDIANISQFFSTFSHVVLHIISF